MRKRLKHHAPNLLGIEAAYAAIGSATSVRMKKTVIHFDTPEGVWTIRGWKDNSGNYIGIEAKKIRGKVMYRFEFCGVSEA